MNTKFYKRKVDNGWANQIISVTNGVFERITFEELGNGQHYGFIPNTFEVGKKMPHGFLKQFGFKEFKPSENFINTWNVDMLQELEYNNR
jgi:hypothetical protein